MLQLFYFVNKMQQMTGSLYQRLPATSMRTKTTDRKGDMDFKYNEGNMSNNRGGAQPGRGSDLAAGD